MSAEDRLRAVFAKFDQDGSGEINARELLNVLMELGKSEDEAKDLAGAILAKCDKNEDMRVTLDEFLAGLL